MHYYGHRLKSLILALSLALFAPLGSYAGEPIRVVASVKPVAALLEAVMDGVAKPTLLLTGQDSPHHFSLRPSQVRALKADIIFYISDDYEYFLTRPLKQLDDKSAVMKLVDAPGLTLLPIREFEDTEDDHDHKHGANDPHLWLLPENMILLAHYTAEILAARYPEHAERFRDNAEAFIKKLDESEKAANEKLEPYKGKGFAMFHDGYQYFEKAFGLNAVAVLSDSAFHQVRPKAMQKIRRQAREGKITCLVGEPQSGKNIMESLSRQMGIPAIQLDPEGVSLNHSGTEYWQSLYADMAQKFINCFEGKGS